MNRKQKRMEDIKEAKDRKMKKVAAGLAVVLVAILAFQVPKLLKHGGSSTPAAAATTTDASAVAPTTAAPTAAPSATASSTAAAAVTAVASSKLPNSDTLPRVGKAQLFSFSHFAGKDPFAQQVGATQGLPTPSTSSSSTSASSAATASTGTAAKVTQRNSTRVLAVTGAARISINGRVQIVRPGASFPSANPLFRLVSVRNGVARIGIASGSYSSGARTVSLAAGRSLTLVDTADGIRYQLRLLSH
jgi:hypothetical protein